MELKLLNEELAICKIRNLSSISYNSKFLSVTTTWDEISLVCEANHAPSDAIEVTYGWRVFKIMGKLEFSAIGIIAKISAVLAENGISIFVISTFNTDYILVKSNAIENAVKSLTECGYFVNAEKSTGGYK